MCICDYHCFNTNTLSLLRLRFSGLLTIGNQKIMNMVSVRQAVIDMCVTEDLLFNKAVLLHCTMAFNIQNKVQTN